MQEQKRGFAGHSYTSLEAFSHPKLKTAHLQDYPEQRVAVIRTSDRIQFKLCRRRWAWQSHMKMNLEPTTAATPLWFGTGIHFALEDLHGYKKYEKPLHAFRDYVKATITQGRQYLPDDWKEHVGLGECMLDYYYEEWLKNRDPLQTLVINGVPQVEVNFIIDVPFDLAGHGYDSHWDKVVYAGTIDRVTVDAMGNIWLVDYKTAKALKTSHFANDPQVSAYCWAASQIYQAPVAGLMYWQFLKDLPTPPQPLVSGKISTNKQQRTTHALYKKALRDNYGDKQNWPEENLRFLNLLASMESEDQDAYIRRDKIYKSAAAHQSEGTKILMELEDILNPNLPLYPNPTFLCPSMCPFYEPCVSMDDGSDWDQQLTDETQQRATSDESWRKFLIGAEAIKEVLSVPAEEEKDFV